MKKQTNNPTRDALGLLPPKPGVTECLMCEQPFHSWDVRRNKRCPKCEQKLRKGLETEPDEQYWDDIETLIIELEDDYIDFVMDCPFVIDKPRRS